MFPKSFSTQNPDHSSPRAVHENTTKRLQKTGTGPSGFGPKMTFDPKKEWRAFNFALAGPLQTPRVRVTIFSQIDA
jgi:hypothetical protein